MAGLFLLVCFDLLMLGLATAGPDGPLLQGRSIAECDSNCGTWCCPPANRCGYVEMAGGWSCFKNTSYSESASMELSTTASTHNLASTSPGFSHASVSTHPSSTILSTATVASTTASSEITPETNRSPQSNMLLRWKYYCIAIAIAVGLW